MKIETIVDKLDDYLAEYIYVMLINVENEKYEDATRLRDEIDSKIIKIKNLIVRHNLSTLTDEEIHIQLSLIKFGYIDFYSDQLKIDNSRRVIQI